MPGKRIVIKLTQDEQHELETYVRGCLKSSDCRESAKHQTCHGEINHRLTALRQPFIVFAQAT
jgi:hypothetical protein